MCFACRCIFDVFVGGGKFQVPLFCHLHPLPLSSIFKLYTFTSPRLQILGYNVIVYIFLYCISNNRLLQLWLFLLHFFFNFLKQICKWIVHYYYHITESNFDYVFTITSEFHATFLCFYVGNFHPFASTQRIPCSISCMSDLLVMNCLSFCLFVC